MASLPAVGSELAHLPTGSPMALEFCPCTCPSPCRPQAVGRQFITASAVRVARVHPPPGSPWPCACPRPCFRPCPCPRLSPLASSPAALSLQRTKIAPAKSGNVIENRYAHVAAMGISLLATWSKPIDSIMFVDHGPIFESYNLSHTLQCRALYMNNMLHHRTLCFWEKF